MWRADDERHPSRNPCDVHRRDVADIVTMSCAIGLMDDQAMRIAVAFTRELAKQPNSRLCRACAGLLGVSGVGITILSGEQAGPICISNPRMRSLEELQFTMGRGPCHDAYQSGSPVHAAVLDGRVETLWPTFVDLARESGVTAVFAFPLATHGVKVGVLTLYHDREGELTATQNSDSLAISAVLAETILSLQEAAPTGSVAHGLDAAVSYRAEVFQASGMLAIHLQITPADALLRIRAHAFANGFTAGAVSREIVAGRLRLDDDRAKPEEGI
jgi:hypothetical protein